MFPNKFFSSSATSEDPNSSSSLPSSKNNLSNNNINKNPVSVQIPPELEAPLQSYLQSYCLQSNQQRQVEFDNLFSTICAAPQENRVTSSSSPLIIEAVPPHPAGVMGSPNIKFGENWDSLITKFTSEVNNLEIVQSQSDSFQFQQNFDHIYIPDIEFDCSMLVVELEGTVAIFLDNFLYPLKWSYHANHNLRQSHHNLNFEHVDRVTEVEQKFEEIMEKIDKLCLLVDKAKACLMQAQKSTSQNHYHQTTVHEPFQYYLNKLHQLRSTLIKNSLVVDTQYASIIKKSDTIEPTVRFLGGQKYFNKFMGPQSTYGPPVKCGVINKIEAKILHGDMRSLSSGSETKIVFDTTNGPLNNNNYLVPKASTIKRKRAATSSHSVGLSVVNFGELVLTGVPSDLKQVKSPGCIKQDDDDLSVATKMYCLVFYCKMEIFGQFEDIWCCGRPFLFMTNVSQKPMAMLTCAWYDHFRLNFPQWTPFTAQQEVPWSSLGTALSNFFQSETNTMKPLSKLNLRTLQEKILGPSSSTTGHYPPSHPMKRQMLKKSFCEWFCQTLKLFVDPQTMEDMKKVWDSGYMIGYISGAEAERVLTGQVVGTSILRFSDSTPSGVTISFVSGTDGQPHHCVYSLSLLQQKSLPFRILEEPVISTLFYTLMTPATDPCDRFLKEWRFGTMNKNDAFFPFQDVSPESPQPVNRSARTATGKYVPLGDTIQDSPATQ